MPPKDDRADAPSRSLSDFDCSLSPAAWHQVDTAFGPTPLIWWLSRSMYKQVAPVVLLDSLHRFVVPKLLALIVFAQDISSDENAYVFPTFVLIDPLLKYLCSQRC